MPDKTSLIRLDRETQDRRVKIPLSEHETIRKLYDSGEWSQRALARKYGVSRRLIVFITKPERYEHHRQESRIRRLDGRYEDRKQLTDAARALRRRKHMLFGKHSVYCKHDKEGNYL